MTPQEGRTCAEVAAKGFSPPGFLLQLNSHPHLLLIPAALASNPGHKVLNLPYAFSFSGSSVSIHSFHFSLCPSDYRVLSVHFFSPLCTSPREGQGSFSL